MLSYRNDFAEQATEPFQPFPSLTSIVFVGFVPLRSADLTQHSRITSAYKSKQITRAGVTMNSVTHWWRKQQGQEQPRGRFAGVDPSPAAGPPSSSSLPRRGRESDIAGPRERPRSEETRPDGESRGARRRRRQGGRVLLQVGVWDTGIRAHG